MENGTDELDVYLIKIYGSFQERRICFWAFIGGIA
jgi:hypothetical protein